MRITNQMMTNNAIQHMSDNLEKLNELQEKFASGKEFQYASDDPLKASISLQLKSTLQASSDYQSTANLTKDWLSANDFNFQQLEDLADRAITLTTRGLNDTLGGTERASSLAVELTELINQAVDTGNTNHQGKYIFSGLKDDQKAFDMPDENTITFQGLNGVLQRSISPSHSVTMNINGDDAILPFLKSLVSARNALANNNTTDLRTALDSIQKSLDTLNQYRTSNGARMRQVDASIDYMEKSDIMINSLLSKNRDANLTEVISILKGQETTYQAVLEVGNRAISALSLFDYMR